MASPASSGGEGSAELVTFPKNPAPVAQPIPLELPAGQSSSAVKALRSLIALIAIVAIGWGAYNYGWPALRAMNESAPEQAIPAPLEPAPAPQEVPVAPLAPTASMIGTPGADIATVTADLTPSGIIAGLSAEARKGAPQGSSIREVSVNGPTGAVSFPGLIAALLPEGQPSGLADLFATGFESAFTSYIFHDDKGAWPGYIVKIAQGGPDIVTLADRLQKLESASYQNFFLSSPGAAQAFRTGQVKEQYMNRFAAFSTPGASFNYGIFGQYVIINTSYGGLLRALELLAL